MNRQAFTLIELLVVLAIIAVLASLATPAIGSAIERGRAAKCSNNLRQIGAAALQYVADHDYRFPAFEIEGIALPDEVENKGTPLELLGPYGITQATLICPTDAVTSRNVDEHDTSYHFSPVLQDERPVDVTIYTRRGMFRVGNTSWLTIAADSEALHNGKKNRVMADGRVIQR
jgi:prepilin-type N-terminal cleavage/methylation domain-containing protein